MLTVRTTALQVGLHKDGRSARNAEDAVMLSKKAISQANDIEQAAKAHDAAGVTNAQAGLATT
jgi:hypothetical protein